MLGVEARITLDDFELDIAVSAEPGRCLALAGPSGAGKTTVLSVVAGFLRPEHGVVTCDGGVWLDTGRKVNLPPEKRRCGYVFQDYALFDHLSAWQNVAYGLRDLPRRERRSRAEALLDRFGLLARANARPRTLSGGERQRVAVARALAREPSALLLDEPLSALDTRTRSRAGRELAGVLRDAGVPAILVTHDFSEAVSIGDHVAIIDRGRVIQHGTPNELAAAPASAFVADFTGAVVLTGTARPGRDGLTLVDLDGGDRVASTDTARGPVAASIYPWEIVIEAADSVPSGSARNHLTAVVTSISSVGGRVRLGLAASQPLVAEVSHAAVQELDLRPGARVTASWKAAATRLVSM